MDDVYDGRVLNQFGLEEEKSTEEDDDFVPSEIQRRSPKKKSNCTVLSETDRQEE